MAYSCFQLPLVVYWDLPARWELPRTWAPAAAFAGTTIAAAETMGPPASQGLRNGGIMRIRLSTGDGTNLAACPHQFVGRCDDCAAAAGLNESDQMLTDEGGTTFYSESGPYPE